MASIEQTRSWLRDIFAHDYAQKAHLLRKVMERGYGMSDCTQPFPGTQTTTTIQCAPRRSLWPAAAAAAAAVGGLGLGALAVQYYASARQADAQIRVYWGDTEITPQRPAEAMSE